MLLLLLLHWNLISFTDVTWWFLLVFNLLLTTAAFLRMSRCVLEKSHFTRNTFAGKTHFWGSVNWRWNRNISEARRRPRRSSFLRPTIVCIIILGCTRRRSFIIIIFIVFNAHISTNSLLTGIWLIFERLRKSLRQFHWMRYTRNIWSSLYIFFIGAFHSILFTVFFIHSSIILWLFSSNVLNASRCYSM